MRNLNLGPITNSAQYRVKKGSLQFLQDAYTEGLAATIIALIGPGYNPATVYLLFGATNSGTYPAYSIISGCAFFNGEIFYVDAAAFTATGTNVAVFQIATAQYTTNADPVTLTDSTIHNIHDIRKIQIVQGASLSTIADFSQAYRLNFAIPPQLNLTAATGGIHADNVLQLIGSYPNIAAYVPTPPSLAFPVYAAGNFNIGDIAGGHFTFAVVFVTPVPTAGYTMLGCIISNGTPLDDSNVTWSVRNKTTAGFTVTFNEGTPTIQNVAFEWLVIKTS